MIGFKAFKSEVIKLDSNRIMPVIILEQSGTALKEVTVTSQKALVGA